MPSKISKKNLFKGKIGFYLKVRKFKKKAGEYLRRADIDAFMKDGENVSGKTLFVFSSKNRPEYSRTSLASMDDCSGFDVIWLDASSEENAMNLFKTYAPKNFRLAGRFADVRGGPDVAILLGLMIGANKGYANVGLIENDMKFSKDWFPRIIELLHGTKEINAGGASLFSVDSRIIKKYPTYATSFNMGACMALFKSEAAKKILANYGYSWGGEFAKYFEKKYGIDLRNNHDMRPDGNDRWLGCDWKFAYILDRNGWSSIMSVPSMVENMDLDVTKQLHASYI